MNKRHIGADDSTIENDSKIDFLFFYLLFSLNKVWQSFVLSIGRFWLDIFEFIFIDLRWSYSDNHFTDCMKTNESNNLSKQKKTILIFSLSFSLCERIN